MDSEAQFTDFDDLDLAYGIDMQIVSKYRTIGERRVNLVEGERRLRIGDAKVVERQTEMATYAENLANHRKELTGDKKEFMAKHRLVMDELQREIGAMSLELINVTHRNIALRAESSRIGSAMSDAKRRIDEFELSDRALEQKMDVLDKRMNAFRTKDSKRMIRALREGINLLNGNIITMEGGIKNGRESLSKLEERSERHKEHLGSLGRRKDYSKVEKIRERAQCDATRVTTEIQVKVRNDLSSTFEDKKIRLHVEAERLRTSVADLKVLLESRAYETMMFTVKIDSAKEEARSERRELESVRMLKEKIVDIQSRVEHKLVVRKERMVADLVCIRSEYANVRQEIAKINRLKGSSVRKETCILEELRTLASRAEYEARERVRLDNMQKKCDRLECNCENRDLDKLAELLDTLHRKIAFAEQKVWHSKIVFDESPLIYFPPNIEALKDELACHMRDIERLEFKISARESRLRVSCPTRVLQSENRANVDKTAMTRITNKQHALHARRERMLTCSLHLERVLAG